MQSALAWLQKKNVNTEANHELQSAKKHMESAKQLMREAHEDSPDLERIGEANVGSFSLDRFSAPKSEQLSATLVNELGAARKDAMKCFEAKDVSTVEARIDALRIAIHSSSLYRLFVTKTLGNSDNLDFWMTEVFADNDLKDAVKAAIKIHEDQWPLKQAFRQRASYLLKVEHGQAVIEILKELNSIFSPPADSMQKLLKKHFSQDDRYLIPLKSMMEKNPQPNRANFGVKLHSEQHSIEQLKQAYRAKLQHYNPFGIVLGSEFDMRDSFVPVTISGLVRNQDETVNDHETLIKKAFNGKSRLAIVRGEALSGKTTLTQKICYDWATGAGFSQYDLILLLELRNAPDDRYETILDVAQAGIRDNDCLNRIDYSDKRVLVLLDGYDEKREAQVCEQLDRLLSSEARKEQSFDLLITSRPSRKIERKSGASFWKIVGLTDDAQRKEYIRKHIQFRLSFNSSERTSFDDHCAAVGAKLQNNGALNDLAKSPIMLTFICLVHERLVQGSKAELFSNLMKWIILQHDKKWPKQRIIQRLWGVANLSDKLSEQEASEAVEKWRQFVHVQRLGHLAFNGELNKRRILEVFPADDLGGTGKTAITKFENIGLLKETQQQRYESTTTVQCPKHQFVHRVFQEFLAALYLLYWSTDMTEAHKLLREKSAYSSSIDPKHIDLGQMIFDVLMAERNTNALNSIRLLLSSLTTNKTTPISFQSRINMQPEHEFLQKVLQQCRKLASLHINGSGADFNFQLKIALPALNNEYNKGSFKVTLTHCNFFDSENKGELPMASIECDGKIDVRLHSCEFDARRLLSTVNAINKKQRLISLSIDLCPDTMAKLAKLADSNLEASKWSGTLFVQVLQADETARDKSLHRLLQMLSGATELTVARHDSLSRQDQSLTQAIKFADFSFFNLPLRSLKSIRIAYVHISGINWEKTLGHKFANAPKLKSIILQNCSYDKATWNQLIDYVIKSNLATVPVLSTADVKDTTDSKDARTFVQHQCVELLIRGTMFGRRKSTSEPDSTRVREKSGTGNRAVPVM